MKFAGETLSQVADFAWLFLIIIAFGGLWKIFHVLYVKPRDFRIESLEHEIDSLKGAPTQPVNHKSPTSSNNNLPDNSVADKQLPVEPMQVEQEVTEDDLAEGLRSLGLCP